MSTSPLLKHEERIFKLFTYDRSFVEWKSKRGMQKGEAHYKKSLALCRQQSSEAYFPLLCVIYKWIEDAYRDYGLRLAHRYLELKPISLDEFMDAENTWRAYQFQPQGEFHGVLAPIPGGYYRFFEYNILLEPIGSHVVLNFGGMPYSLSHTLIHYLSHTYFSSFRNLQGPIQIPC